MPNCPSTIKRYFSVLLILITLPLLAYFNTLNNSFHYDDPAIKHYLTITDDSIIKALGDLRNRSILKHVFAINYYFSKDSVFGYHLTNTIIHIFTSIGVFSLSFLLLQHSAYPSKRHEAYYFALVAAIFFALSPMATQAVTYIIGRSSSLATLFYLISFLLFFMGKQKSAGNPIVFFLFALVFFIIGLGIKEILITVPAIAIFSIYFFSSVPAYKLIKKKLPFILVLIFLIYGYMLFRAGWHWDIEKLLSVPDVGSSVFSAHEETNPRIRYLITQINIIPYHYLRLLFFPFNQNLDPDFPYNIPFFSFGSLAASFCIIVLLLIALCRRRNSVLSLMICWFFITLAPTSSIVPLADAAIEHRMYLPSVGFFIVIALLIGAFCIKKNRIPLLILILLFFFTTTLTRNRIWLDDYTLWSDAALKSPEKSRPHNNLGGAIFSDLKDFKTAIIHYKKAISLDPNYFGAHKNLASAYFEAGMIDEAIRKFEHVYFLDEKSRPLVCGFLGDSYITKGNLKKAEKYFIEAIRFSPQESYNYKRLGTIYKNSHEWNKAKDAYSKGLIIDPRNHLIIFYLAETYMLNKEYEKAEKLYLKTLGLRPDFESAMINIGITYKKMGNYKSARHWLRKSIQLNPNSEISRINLGLMYKETGNYNDSIKELTQAIRINPSNPQTYNKIGSVHYLNSDFPKAREAFEKAIELSPNFSEARHNLEVIRKTELKKHFATKTSRH